MRYRLIGIDIDGTLLDPHHQVTEPVKAAIAAARQRGVLVVPCTGRGWRESQDPIRQVFGDPPPFSKPVADQLGTPNSQLGTHPPTPGVFITGAAVCDLFTGKSLDLAMIEPHVALAIVEHLRDMPEAVLVFRDLSIVGHDYLITGRGSLTPNTQWWFQKTGATVHYQRDVTADDLRHTLRVGVVASPARMDAAKARIKASLGDEVFFHSFEALQMPDPSESMHILEIFAAGCDKWRGLTWVAQAHGIEPSQIAAIGDSVNDLQMLASAGCGIAMGNAIDEAKQAARRVTRDNTQHGVAYAIEQMLAGVW